MAERSLTGELLEQFEYALPIIKADTEEINIETSRDCRGEINVRNIGGSVLEGMVSANLPALKFYPDSFTGNKAALQYRFSAEIYRPGDAVYAQAVITSNGGELVIPVNIRITARAFTSDDGTTLGTLEDFAAFAMNNPAEAARIFGRKDFGEWLSVLNAARMELYEHLKFDGVKERAVDNFLILHGLKKKARIYLDGADSDVPIRPGSKDPINLQINARLDEWGYVEADVLVKDRTPWLNLITKRLTLPSFARGQAVVDYIIDPSLLSAKRARADIIIQPLGGKPLTHRVFAYTEPVLGVKLNKDSFGFTDSGQVIIENNTAGDLVVEILPRHDFVRFQGKRYLIGARAEIPFEIRLVAQRLGMLPERNNLVINSSLLIKTVYDKAVYTRALDFGITDLKGLL